MRRDLRNEAAWLPATLDELEDVRGRLVDAGHPPPIVNGLTGWLVAKALGERDATASDTRSRYRRILAELGPGPYGDRPPARALRDAGFAASTRQLIGAAAGVGVAALGVKTGNPALIALAPIIPEPSVTSSDEDELEAA